MRNGEVFKREEEYIVNLEKIRTRKKKWIGHWLRRLCLLLDVFEGMVEGKRGKGRKHYQVLGDINIDRSYKKMKKAAEDTHDKTCLQTEH